MKTKEVWRVPSWKDELDIPFEETTERMRFGAIQEQLLYDFGQFMPESNGCDPSECSFWNAGDAHARNAEYWQLIYDYVQRTIKENHLDQSDFELWMTESVIPMFYDKNDSSYVWSK